MPPPEASQYFDPDLLKALPPAARQREVIKVYNTFVGNTQHLFVHYVTPILKERRYQLDSKKRFYKTPEKLWSGLGDQDQQAFWHHQVAQLRQRVEQGLLTEENVLLDAGDRSEWTQYVYFAEFAVAKYLNLPMPERPQEEATLGEAGEGKPHTVSDLGKTVIGKNTFAPLEKDFASSTSSPTNPAVASLLDTLPDPFTVEARMLYGNFAHAYPYTSIISAVGEAQKGKLRQVADWFDYTGKVFFYYYAFPHLWKAIRPTNLDETIATVAHRLWALMPAEEKEEWRRVSASTKRVLGDGKIEGLEVLMLDGMAPEVLRLHEVMRAALGRVEK